MTEPVKKRPYVSVARQAKAEATRRRIIDAASALFLERGYGGTTTIVIAEAAMTSEASVFAVFGSKADLLVEVVRDRVVRDSDFPLRGQPRWARLAENPDKMPAIEAFAGVVRRAHDRSWRLLAIAAAAGEDDTAVRDAVARGAQGRHDDCAWFVREIIGSPPSEAARRADEVWTLISVENYRHLVVERSRTHWDYEAWLSSMLSLTLGLGS